MWQGIQGHDAIAERFARAAEQQRINGSFLFVGPAGIGKRTFAIALAKTVLCQRERGTHTAFEACGECRSCKLFGETINHPDFHLVSKPPDKSAMPLELLVGEKDKRGRSGLIYDISHTSALGGKKVAIIDDADTLQEEAANSLLKTLEEPPDETVLILIGTSPAKQLPTIRSRCRIIRFSPIPLPELATLLLSHRFVATRDDAERLASRSGGSIARAASINDAELETERREILSLMQPPLAPVTVATRLLACVERAGKEAVLRRARLRYFFEEVCENERNEIRRGGDTVPQRIARLDKTLEAIEQIDRMATPAYVIEAWATQIATASGNAAR
ncbi:MAG: ATP-binding protein [Thermoguttaceae bacterium]